jgi:hypothetical protein
VHNSLRNWLKLRLQGLCIQRFTLGERFQGFSIILAPQCTSNDSQTHSHTSHTRTDKVVFYDCDLRVFPKKCMKPFCKRLRHMVSV